MTHEDELTTCSSVSVRSDSCLSVSCLDKLDRGRRIFLSRLQPGMEVLLDTCGSPRARYLLLIYIFLLKAAADCPKPEGSKTTVLTNEALLLNEFPEGIKVRLECVNGHVKEKGSEFITCMDGKWSEPDLTCKKKDCGPPKPRPNMSFNIIAGTLFGDKIRAICDKGYQIRGPSYMTCYSSGWAGKPRCEMVTCEKPTEVMNGRNSWNSKDDPQYGEMINYSCNEGYTLVGKATIVCSETGEYDSPPPTCEDLTATPTAHRDVTTPTPTFSPPAQEASSAARSSATPTAHRDVTTPTPTVSPSARGGTDMTGGEREIAATTSVISTTPSSFQEQTEDAVDVKTIALLLCVVLAIVAGILVLCCAAVIWRLLKKRGSYDTREDLKPELLQSQIFRFSA